MGIVSIGVQEHFDNRNAAGKKGAYFETIAP